MVVAATPVIYWLPILHFTINPPHKPQSSRAQRERDWGFLKYRSMLTINYDVRKNTITDLTEK